jgi:hypothetical protein
VKWVRDEVRLSAQGTNCKHLPRAMQIIAELNGNLRGKDKKRKRFVDHLAAGLAPRGASPTAK